MSDREEHDQAQDPTLRRKRLRACDQCRKKKVRCGGLLDETMACMTCVLAGEKCTYPSSNESRKRRYIDVQYIEELEARVAKLQLLVQQLQAKLDARESTSGPSIIDSERNISSVLPRHSSSALDLLSRHEESADEGLLEGFKSLSISDTQHVRYLGRSSDFPLVKAVIRMKHELVKNGDVQLSGLNFDDSMAISYRRPQFWRRFFDFIPPDPPYTDFPEPVLMRELLDNYFRSVHINFPLLHHPTLLQGIALGQHLVDEAFGATVLLACALGARFSSNPAMMPPGTTNWQLAGWRWFTQVRDARKLVSLKATTLADLQVITLAAAYMGAVAFPITIHAIVSHGLRLAQDLGAHRRTTYSATPTLEDELRKRAFWCLIAMDRAMGAILGRPISIQDEEFDFDYPVECDDEYWFADGSHLEFRQPPEQPSTVSHFNWYLKFSQIRSHAMRDLYSLQAAHHLKDSERAQQIVAQLDSELNDWDASLPPFLKYDTQREDMTFAAQAASLCASYHALRIFIHRPFITAGTCAPLPFPSRTICTSAARASIDILDRQVALAGPAQVYEYHVAHLFQAAIILLLHAWQSLRAGAVADVVRELEHVRRALHVLRVFEQHYDCAGRFWDVINDLALTVEARMSTGALGIPGERGGSDLANTAGALYTGQPASAGSIPANSSSATPGSMPQAGTLSDLSGPWPLSGPADALVDMTPEMEDPDLDAIFADLLPSLAFGAPFVDEPQAYLSSESAFEGIPPGPYFSANGYGPS
ncbi:Zn(II)2Cys6 transcription factor [Phanerochaete sordida]|uniref:Zn(II)2Cys6 transcription factor n=1 Tax=Phanerochaete sordida TaxID=48140 RepID=A0A9P3G7M2_9APHY|nr:Zn(II)2Cys6 transcription factor [Phanerochaete sordida]